MFFREDSLDDLLKVVYPELLRPKELVPASRGRAKEFIGVQLQLNNPRARLSRSEGRGKVFSAIGELFWYLAASNELSFIANYIKEYTKDSADGKTLPGAYGPRLFGTGRYAQIENVITLLKARPTSRRAVAQIYDSSDLELSVKTTTESKSIEVPCTCTLQFFVRSDRLEMIVHMRSNDAYLGLPHDIFCFTMIQEIVARAVGVELGSYRHYAGSLHIYEDYLAPTEQYLAEGWHQSKPMPPMPDGDQQAHIDTVLQLESLVRSGQTVDVEATQLPDYWKDIVRLLQIYGATNRQRSLDAGSVIEQLKAKMNANVYDRFIDDRKSRLVSAD